jgi:hypothetical protein
VEDANDNVVVEEEVKDFGRKNFGEIAIPYDIVSTQNVFLRNNTVFEEKTVGLWLVTLR